MCFGFYRPENVCFKWLESDLITVKGLFRDSSVWWWLIVKGLRLTVFRLKKIENFRGKDWRPRDEFDWFQDLDLRWGDRSTFSPEDVLPGEGRRVTGVTSGVVYWPVGTSFPWLSWWIRETGRRVGDPPRVRDEWGCLRRHEEVL